MTVSTRVLSKMLKPDLLKTAEGLDKRLQAQEKVKEAFQLEANLGDREIRMIRANAMGISLHEYERRLRDIGRDDF